MSFVTLSSPLWSDYQLLDFGAGRKLERFGRYILDRPSAAAETVLQADRRLWARADARFERVGQSGRWHGADRLTEDWRIGFQLEAGELVFQLKPTPFGHVGLFAEQAENWQWLARQVQLSKRPLRVLHLFAYTGGSTLAAAGAGAQVTHVDAARNIVQWARQNAELSQLASAPIRWIAEDARKFTARELRRGRFYDAVILDPPSYGHGPAGQAWKIEQDLEPLLQQCAALTAEHMAFALITCHTPGFGPKELAAALQRLLGTKDPAGIEARPLTLRSADGRQLEAGTMARWGQPTP